MVVFPPAARLFEDNSFATAHRLSFFAIFAAGNSIQCLWKPIEYSNEEKIEWTMIFIYEFAKKYELTMKQAFGYLSRFKGIDFIDRHYGYVHTQSFESMIDDIGGLCRKNGGRLG